MKTTLLLILFTALALADENEKRAPRARGSARTNAVNRVAVAGGKERVTTEILRTCPKEVHPGCPGHVEYITRTNSPAR